MSYVDAIRCLAVSWPLDAPGIRPSAQERRDSQEDDMNDSLAVLWVTKDKEAALNMVFMYTKNSKLRKWWGKVTLIIWGPSGPLLVSDAELQKELKALKDAGVELQACKACSDRYGISDQLTALGVDVKYMGQPLTELLKSGTAVLSV